MCSSPHHSPQHSLSSSPTASALPAPEGTEFAAPQEQTWPSRLSHVKATRGLTELWEVRGTSQRWSRRALSGRGCWLREEQECHMTKGVESQKQRLTEKKARPNGSRWRQRQLGRSFLALVLQAPGPSTSPSSRTIQNALVKLQCETSLQLASQPSGICCHNEVTESLPCPHGSFSPNREELC